LNETEEAAKRNYGPYSRSVKSIMVATRALDPTRPINDASGYFHVETDIFTVHDYDQNHDTFHNRYASVAPDTQQDVFVAKSTPELSVRYQGQPYMVDEYGGTHWTKDFVNQPKKNSKTHSHWGHGKSSGQIEDHIKALTDTLLNHPHISGSPIPS